MRDIAGAVGVRQSAIYNHFGSKQDILVDLMTTHMEGVLTRVEAALVGVPASQRLEAFARFHVVDHLDRPEDVFLAYMELRSLESPAPVFALRDRYEGILQEILRVAGISEPAVRARALLAMMTGVTVWFRDGGRLDREAVARIYVNLVRNAVGSA